MNGDISVGQWRIEKQKQSWMVCRTQEMIDFIEVGNGDRKTGDNARDGCYRGG
jgi:hypothetical protein